MFNFDIIDLFILRRAYNVSELIKPGILGLDYYRTYMKKLIDDETCVTEILRKLESNVYMRNQLLRDTDWASMNNSHEIRVPFLDKLFLRKLRSLEKDSCKFLQKKDLKPLFSSAISKKFLERPKTGFSTPLRSKVEQKYKTRFESRTAWSTFVLEKYLENWSVKCHT